MWKVLLFVLLFLAVFAATYILHYKIEHLTVQEVDDKTTKAVDRITTLEDEYKQLQAKIDTQESRMGAASTQAAQTQALMNTTD